MILIIVLVFSFSIFLPCPFHSYNVVCKRRYVHVLEKSNEG